MTERRLAVRLIMILILFTFTIGFGVQLLARQDVSPEDNPRYRRVPAEFRPVIHDLEEEHERLIDLWVETIETREKIAEQMMILGRRDRRDAESAIRGLERNMERLESRFRQVAERVTRSYQREFDSLQEEIWNRQEAMDPTDMEHFHQQQEQIQDLREKAIEAEKPVRAFSAMIRALGFNLPEPYEVARLSGGRREGPRRYSFLRRNAPRLLDARMDVLDCFADIENMLKEKREAGQDWGPRQENELESLISIAQRELQNLKNQLDRELRSELRDKERLSRDIERMKSRKEGRSGRSYERAVEQLSEMEGEFEDLEERIGRYRLLVSFPRQYNSIINMLDLD